MNDKILLEDYIYRDIRVTINYVEAESQFSGNIETTCDLQITRWYKDLSTAKIQIRSLIDEALEEINKATSWADLALLIYKYALEWVDYEECEVNERSLKFLVENFYNKI